LEGKLQPSSFPRRLVLVSSTTVSQVNSRNRWSDLTSPLALPPLPGSVRRTTTHGAAYLCVYTTTRRPACTSP
jgi:hypothetical protein